MDKKISNRIFVGLIVVYVVVAFVSVLLPQDYAGMTMPTDQLPVPLPILALANMGIAFVLYGGLGFIGLTLSRKLCLPEIWDSAVTNRQRFVIPALIGFAVGIAIIIGDWLFAPINGIGNFPHPSFPNSILASIGAGIGEEIVFRLFFISLWTWLISRVVLGGGWQTQIYWFFSIVSAILFALGHLPSLMFLFGWTSMAQASPVLLVEMILLNGLLSLFAAYYFKKYGFLAAVGIHFWADIIWHVLWGLA